ncbi:hypothetical protein Ccrd_022361 [Cynara cardunculus var. scolymus]|uniref:Uncharacterized protein n=1 Tax=Cynara cardunculus var. scolymus TaxID=59895 RepID=A0A103XZ01_CYNCS|nr:hypothetical protein Ccrd_022361 [Cynara cardunculus var. scolymus]
MCSFQILKPTEKKPKFNFGINFFGSTTIAKPGNIPPGVEIKPNFLGSRAGDLPDRRDESE